LNEALPRWRTFSSAPPAEPPGDGAGGPDDGTAPVATGSRRRPSDLITLAAVAVGSAGAGAAALVIVGVLVSGAQSGGLTAALGEPLDGPGAAESAVLSGAWTESPPSGGSEIVVDVGGAVARPGLVRLRAGDRIGDAIEAAGGFGPRVDIAESGRSLNLAQPLSDGLKVVVPELGASGAPRAAPDDGRIDLNAADQAALESLPGIGPVTATKIIEARTEQPFRAVEDLRDRGIVGDAVYADIEALVRAAG
jgi:competence protein ComEA